MPNAYSDHLRRRMKVTFKRARLMAGYTQAAAAAALGVSVATLADWEQAGRRSWPSCPNWVRAAELFGSVEMAQLLFAGTSFVVLLPPAADRGSRP